MPFYIPFTEDKKKQALKELNAATVDELYQRAISKEFLTEAIEEFPSLDGPALEREFKRLSSLNSGVGFNLFAGGGFYRHYIPPAVFSIVSRTEFYTAYTPYQPEASQGSLQAIYEYQSSICRLANMDVSNASLYDGGTAMAEAALMAVRIKRRDKIVVDSWVNPLYRKMLQTYLSGLDIDIVELDRDEISQDVLKDASCFIVAMPDFLGRAFDVSRFVEMAHKAGALLLQQFYPVSLAILSAPGDFGVDIAFAEGQSLGIPLSSGGPYLGILACKKEFVRKMPGRIVGRTIDRNGKASYVLTLQAREQHIRREKATSNVCSNQALCALQALAYVMLMGRAGLKNAALASHKNMLKAMEKARSLGLDVLNGKGGNFNEFAFKVPDLGRFFNDAMVAGIFPGIRLERFYPQLKDYLLMAFTEANTEQEIEECLSLLTRHLGK